MLERSNLRDCYIIVIDHKGLTVVLKLREVHSGTFTKRGQ